MSKPIFYSKTPLGKGIRQAAGKIWRYTNKRKGGIVHLKWFYIKKGPQLAKCVEKFLHENAITDFTIASKPHPYSISRHDVHLHISEDFFNIEELSKQATAPKAKRPKKIKIQVIPVSVEKGAELLVHCEKHTPEPERIDWHGILNFNATVAALDGLRKNGFEFDFEKTAKGYTFINKMTGEVLYMNDKIISN